MTWWNRRLRCLLAPRLCDILQHNAPKLLAVFIFLLESFLRQQMSVLPPPHSLEMLSSALQNIGEGVISETGKGRSATVLGRRRTRRLGLVLLLPHASRASVCPPPPPPGCPQAASLHRPPYIPDSKKDLTVYHRERCFTAFRWSLKCTFTPEISL